MSRRRSWGWWLSILPGGVGGLVVLYAGLRARVRLWIALGVFWLAAGIAGWIASDDATVNGVHHSSVVAGVLLVGSWLGGWVTTFAIEPFYVGRMTSPIAQASRQAANRMRDRRQARELARRDPVLAKEMGLGRPDVKGATDAGLVDFNNASVGALAQLPGVSKGLAGRIVKAREELGGFSSVEDLGIALDLDGDLVERVRDVAIFLPR